MTEPANDDDRTVRASSTLQRTGAPTSAALSTVESSNGDRLPIGTRLAEFEVTGYVGEGGFSIVYLAWDHSLERQVALKEYMPSSLASRSGGTRVFPRSERRRETFEAGLKSFVNEGKLLAQFDHPSLVKVYRFWEDHGTAYMVMPFYEGVTLKDTVRAMTQPPGEAWLLGVLEPLTAALLVIHEAHCFHRDIAPDNVLLLAGSGKPLLLDFGAARRVIGDKTQALTVILKPGYAPIEQYAEDSTMRQGGWTDVYALAAVVYWAVTGKTPPPSVARVLNDSYVPLAQSAAGNYSPSFLTAVDRALAVLPDRRTQSITRLREELGLDVELHASREAEESLADSDVTVIRPVLTQRVDPPALTTARRTPRHDDVPTQSGSSVAPTRNLVWGWLPWVGVVALIATAGVWWMSRPAEPSVDPTARASIPTSAPSPSPSPTATPIPSPPAPPAPTVSSKVEAQALVSQIEAGRDMSIEIKATVFTAGRSSARVQYQAPEPGHAYVLGLRQGRNELQMLYPRSGTVSAKLSAAGKLDVPLSAAAGTTTYYLLWARENRNLAGDGWRLSETGWVRKLDAGPVPITASAIWGMPQCPPDAKQCDAAYGMTEVTDMTNVTSQSAAPAPTPSSDSKAKSERREKAPASRAESPVATEEKPRAKRHEELSAQCRELLNLASLGNTSPELIEKMKTLRCGA